MKMLSPIPIDDIDIDSLFTTVVPLGNETVTLSSIMMNQEEGLAVSLGEGISSAGRVYPFLPSTTMALEGNANNNTPLSHEATEIAFTHFTPGIGFTGQQQEGLGSPSTIGDFSSLLSLSPSPSSGLDPNSDDHSMLVSPCVPIEGNANGMMEPEEGRISRRKQKLVCKVFEQPPTKVKSNKNNPTRVLLHELAITDDMCAKRRKQIANAKKNYNRREAEKIKLVNAQTNLGEALALIERLKKENGMLLKRLNNYEKKANGRVFAVAEQLGYP